MERKEFLNKISGGLTFACVACMMEACSKDSGSGTTTGATLLTVNLATQLLAINDYISDKGIIIVRKAAGNLPASFAAFSNVCPHQGSTVDFVKNNNNFYCPAHGSTFSITGAVVTAPAATGLTPKTIEIAGNNLTVK